MRIRLKYITGIILLPVVLGWIFIETQDCSISDLFSANCSNPPPLNRQHLPEVVPALPNEEPPDQPIKVIPDKDSYSLTKKEYSRYIEGLISLFLQAFQKTPKTEEAGEGTLARFSPDAVGDGDLPPGLAEESSEIQQIYFEMLQEKKRWDSFQQAQYKNVLESGIEPVVTDSRRLYLDVEDNLEYFLELEHALKLHHRLVRDVRSFHDEVQYQQKQLIAQQPYQLYDLKLQLGPFARESAIADALQQSLSAMGAGIYHQEAAQVINRLVNEFTKPVQKLNETLYDTDVANFADNYNFNIYVVYGKKLLDYSNALTQQSSVPLSSSLFRELAIFNQRLIQSFRDLHQAEQYERIRLLHPDLEELERDNF